MNIYKYASPAMFYPLAGKLIPWFAIPAALLFATGALWGKPTWGTWWVWDARMTSTLILLFL